MCRGESLAFFFFFNDTATTEIYTLSLHDALPISVIANAQRRRIGGLPISWYSVVGARELQDRKSTRLNSSHGYISYAVFCLKKKKISRHRRSPYGSTGDSATCSFSAALAESRHGG